MSPTGVAKSPTLLPLESIFADSIQDLQSAFNSGSNLQNNASYQHPVPRSVAPNEQSVPRQLFSAAVVSQPTAAVADIPPPAVNRFLEFKGRSMFSSSDNDNRQVVEQPKDKITDIERPKCEILERRGIPDDLRIERPPSPPSQPVYKVLPDSSRNKVPNIKTYFSNYNYTSSSTSKVAGNNIPFYRSIGQQSAQENVSPNNALPPSVPNASPASTTTFSNPFYKPREQFYQEYVSPTHDSFPSVPNPSPSVERPSEIQVALPGMEEATLLQNYDELELPGILNTFFGWLSEDPDGIITPAEMANELANYEEMIPAQEAEVDAPMETENENTKESEPEVPIEREDEIVVLEQLYASNDSLNNDPKATTVLIESDGYYIAVKKKLGDAIV